MMLEKVAAVHIDRLPNGHIAAWAPIATTINALRIMQNISVFICLAPDQGPLAHCTQQPSAPSIAAPDTPGA